MLNRIASARRSARATFVAWILVVCASLGFGMLSAASPAAAFVPPPNDYVAYNPYYRTGNLEMTAHFSQYGTNWTCKFAGNSPGMVDQSGDLAGYSCAAQNVTEGNYGYTNTDYKYVRLYYGPNYTGAFTCIYPGYYWEVGGIFTGVTNYGQLKFHYGTLYDPTPAGDGQSIWYNVRSMSWWTAC